MPTSIYTSKVVCPTWVGCWGWEDEEATVQASKCPGYCRETARRPMTEAQMRCLRRAEEATSKVSRGTREGFLEEAVLKGKVGRGRGNLRSETAYMCSVCLRFELYRTEWAMKPECLMGAVLKGSQISGTGVQTSPFKNRASGARSSHYGEQEENQKVKPHLPASQEQLS